MQRTTTNTLVQFGRAPGISSWPNIPVFSARGNKALPELRSDLSRPCDRPVGATVFVEVDERAEDDMSDQICHPCNRKQIMRRGGGKVKLSHWVMNKLKGLRIMAPTWVTKMKSLSHGESLSIFQKVSLLFLTGFFVYVGLGYKST